MYESCITYLNILRIIESYNVKSWKDLKEKKPTNRTTFPWSRRTV